ncbi:MAG TPA: FecR domain-containing protein, partial [Gemmataceae bacterium]|nr:FecR domain-containing protein [Gemmataceae bacterium]
FFGSRKAVEDPAGIAELEEVEGEVYLVTASGKVPAERKNRLHPGQILQTHGEGSYAVVKYGDSTRLELGPDTTLDLLAGPSAPAIVKKVFLKEGTLTAEVAPQPRDHPMILTTPHAEVVSSGNKLSFSSAGETTRIELEEGQAQCRRLSDGKLIEVPSGWYAVASAAEEPFEAQPLPALTTRPRLVLPKGLGPVLALAFTPDGEALASSGWGGEVSFWDVKRGELRFAIHAHSRDVKALALSADGNALATTDDRVVKLWDVPGRKELTALKGLRFAVRALAFAPDGRTLATGGGAKKEGAELKLWDVETGTARLALGGHVREILALAFAPDGRTLASGGRDRGIRLFDALTGKPKWSIAGHRREALALAFSPDSQTLASGSYDGTVKLWDTFTGAERQALKAHAQKIRCLSFSPDGKLLATASNDRSIRLWDAATGQERALIRPRRNVASLAFAPDGRTLATGDWSGLVKLWTLSVKGVP